MVQIHILPHLKAENFEYIPTDIVEINIIRFKDKLQPNSLVPRKSKDFLVNEEINIFTGLFRFY